MQRIAVDIETQMTGERGDPYSDKLLLTAAMDSSGEEYLWEGLEEIPDWFVNVLQDPTIPKYMHFASFDSSYLSHYLGVPIENIVCTHAQERLLNTGLGLENTLKAVTHRRTGVQLDKEVRQNFKYGVITDVEREYAIEDVRYLFAIGDEQELEIKQRGQTEAAKIENELTWIAGQMGYIGIGFDTDKWWSYLPLIRSIESEHAVPIWKFLEVPYSYDILEDIYTGGMSFTSRDLVLQALERKGIRLKDYKVETLRNFYFKTDNEEHRSIINSLILWKKYNKSGTWGYANSVNPITGRLHCSFNPQGTATSRFSSSDENLQNVTVPFDPRINFRHLFVSQLSKAIQVENSRLSTIGQNSNKPRKIVGADYSQIEIRLYSEFTGELREELANGEDIHARSAALVLGRPATKNDRPYGKIVNFGALTFGGGPNAIMDAALEYEIVLTWSEAERYVKLLRDGHPKGEQWGSNMLELMQSQGYMQTAMGHRRWLQGEIRETVARNTPIQSTAADIMKQAIVDLHPKLTQFENCWLVLTVHDELEVECNEEDAKQIEILARETMISAGEKWMKEVPTEVETYISDSWEK